MGNAAELPKSSTVPYFPHPSFSSQTPHWCSFHCQVLHRKLKTRQPWDKVEALGVWRASAGRQKDTMVLPDPHHIKRWKLSTKWEKCCRWGGGWCPEETPNSPSLAINSLNFMLRWVHCPIQLHLPTYILTARQEALWHKYMFRHFLKGFLCLEHCLSLYVY